MTKEIIAALYTIIDGLDAVKSTYKQIPKTITNYPAVIISFEGQESSYRSIKIVERVSNINIRILGNLDVDHSGVQDKVMDVHDAILNAIEDDKNLSAQVAFHRLSSSRFTPDNTNSSLYGIEIEYRPVYHHTRA
jgi:hypothetical protein